jgi:outer membrane protein OmpA-like peptidoglycan-associated protein
MMSGNQANHRGGYGIGHGGGGHDEEEGGAPEWLISFADMVMLLMGFFVILFALNVQPKGGNPGGGGAESDGAAMEVQEIDPELIEAVRRAFHNPLNPDDPRDARVLQAIRERGAGDASTKGVRGREQDVRSPRDIDYFGEGTDVPFAFKSLSITPQSASIITDFAQSQAGRRNVIEVRGHASEPEAFNRPQEGREIAWARAEVVVKRLEAAGIPTARIRVQISGQAKTPESNFWFAAMPRFPDSDLPALIQSSSPV